MTSEIQQTANYCTVIACKANPGGVTVKLYTHAPMGQFLAVGRLEMSEQYLRALQAAILKAKDDADQPMLPPWEADTDNVRWLPPSP